MAVPLAIDPNDPSGTIQGSMQRLRDDAVAQERTSTAQSHLQEAQATGQGIKNELNRGLLDTQENVGLPVSTIGKAFAKGGPVLPVGFKHANPTHKRFGLTGNSSLLKKGGNR